MHVLPKPMLAWIDAQNEIRNRMACNEVVTGGMINNDYAGDINWFIDNGGDYCE